MILVAGEGRRLAPLTDDWPKPLFPIGDRKGKICNKKWMDWFFSELTDF